MKAKSVLIIGMGRFGRHLALRMIDLGNDVMIIDKDSSIIDMLSSKCPDANIGDCTNENVLKALGVNAFDICFVTIGENFQSSLVITSLLKSLGAKCVVAKANQTIQADLLRKIGADEVIYPEKEIAEKVAIRYNSDNIFDFIPLTSEFSIYEVPVLKEWVGKTIIEVNVRKNYNISIVAIKSGNTLNPVPSPDYLFNRDDHIVVIGQASDVFKITSKA
ncbi:MAG: TrkA family potassium uptake protein [Ruminococcaceae bacterium]|nr:TrkA family potassium uptake protein [Oscillospiraceae bacterium]